MDLFQAMIQRICVDASITCRIRAYSYEAGGLSLFWVKNMELLYAGFIYHGDCGL